MITKRLISIVTFGFFLIVVGAVGSFFKWEQANLVMAIGLVFELYAILVYIWNKMKRS
jgi:uncharacterized membrane protein